MSSFATYPELWLTLAGSYRLMKATICILFYTAYHYHLPGTSWLQWAYCAINLRQVPLLSYQNVVELPPDFLTQCFLKPSGVLQVCCWTNALDRYTALEMWNSTGVFFCKYVNLAATRWRLAPGIHCLLENLLSKNDKTYIQSWSVNVFYGQYTACGILYVPLVCVSTCGVLSSCISWCVVP